MRSSLLACILGLAVTVSRSAVADEARTVDGPRLRLGELVRDVPAELADFDLGAAPPPGSSRLLPKDELVRALHEGGVDPKIVKLPAVVRVNRSARRYSPAELAEQARPLLQARLPRGARLVTLAARRGALVSKATSVVAVRLPKLPSRVGQATLTVTAELGEDGAVTARVPLKAVLELGPEAVRPDVARGARVDLVIEHGAASVSASAVALADASLGEVASFKVESTKKVLRARLESADRARVVTQ